MISSTGGTSSQVSSEIGEAEILRDLRDLHTSSKYNFDDIAAHFLIMPSGNIWLGRDLNMNPAMLRGNNTGAVGVFLILERDNNQPSEMAKTAFATLLETLNTQFPEAGFTEQIRSEKAFLRELSSSAFFDNHPPEAITGADMVNWK